ncbi:pantetheine-phosphate adenylyltransferase [Boudabousia liubingyangii]|uniref:pantetheine-phosphate adenylyltransferase n=1 Tax=Boudabousia liubingyangii TaxID=1921764 RepID=UPI0009396A68|nr:pantetheine-phosphate adenylyltransferase [Boudabousia liubingyangii]OKL47569.1 pantetheine-phosphate adenylyltransferase [Boudabousia liubingyangii]
MRLIYPGSFDPFTRGHLDIVQRALSFGLPLTVVVGHNPEKRSWFTPEERVELIRQSVAGAGLDGADRLTVEVHEGLLVAKYAQPGNVLIKGLRGAQDLEDEAVQARFNREIGNLETLFLPSQASFSHISSSIVKQLAQLEVPLAPYVTKEVEAALTQKLAERKEHHD